MQSLNLIGKFAQNIIYVCCVLLRKKQSKSLIEKLELHELWVFIITNIFQHHVDAKEQLKLRKSITCAVFVEDIKYNKNDLIDSSIKSN